MNIVVVALFVYFIGWWLFVFCDAVLCAVTENDYDIKASALASLSWPVLLIAAPFSVHAEHKKQRKQPK